MTGETVAVIALLSASVFVLVILILMIRDVFRGDI